MAILGISATSKTGKSTTINKLISRFPRYGTPKETYRDIPDLDLYEKGTQESQGKIRDFMFKQAKEVWSKRDTNRFVVHDRTLLDNLAITMYLYTKGLNEGKEIITDKFLVESIEMTKKSMSYYHMIYFIPDIKSDGVIIPDDLDKDFRASVDINLMTFWMNFDKGGPLRSTLFPDKNCTMMDEVSGTLEERISYISELMDENGAFMTPDDIDPMDALGGIVGADGMPVVSEEPEYTLEDLGFQPEKLILD